VPTPALAADKSIYAPRASPPCTKNLNLFCHTSIVTPAAIVAFGGFAKFICPPSSPLARVEVNSEPLTIPEAVIVLLAVKVVKEPAAGVEPPIMVLLIVPPVKVGDVRVLLVRVCVPVKVTSEESFVKD